MKKSFTILEVTLSIFLFSIIIIFFYETISNTKKTNFKLKNQINLYSKENFLNNIFYEDLLESNSINILLDKNKNSILLINTLNTYHNPFYNNITYLINKNKELVRIENNSKVDFNKNLDDFLKDSYIDTLLKDVFIFKIIKINNNYLIAIKQKNKDLVYYNILFNYL